MRGRVSIPKNAGATPFVSFRTVQNQPMTLPVTGFLLRQTLPDFSRNILIRSIGTGKMVVEFFSEAISARVCR